MMTQTGNSTINYCHNRAWSDKFIPTIKEIIGPYLLTESSFEVDTQEATDLVVLGNKGLQVACRIRKAMYAERYPNEVTIRSQSAYGFQTELQKITLGFGDWMFYGFAEDDITPKISRWCLLSLDSIRAQWIIKRTQKKLSYEEKENADGTKFAVFDLTKFSKEPNIFIASCPEDYLGKKDTNAKATG
ncbi:MAG: hypothetical protein GY833_16510 [Aestuariibacter sp.]|nr:hypothetical protein [Aestuariibacter sp.]